MNLVWLTLNCSWSHSSLALPLIHNACKKCTTWQWDCYTGTIKDDCASVAAAVAEKQPDLVCASLYLFNRSAVLDVLGRLKALLPSIQIAVGGPECLGDGAPQILSACPFVDFAFQGEGEGIFPAFLDALAQGETINVPGVSCRAVPCSSSPQIYENWNCAPSPCSDPFYDFSKPFVQVETSRGCPNHCAFCTSAGIPLRYRPLNAVQEELTVLHQHGIREIRLLDRTFNVPASRAVKLLQMFRLEFPDMHFHLEFNPAYLPQELREELILARPGQLHLEAGMQSMQPEVLDAIGRENTCARAIEGLSFLCSLNAIVVHSDLISGLPYQTLSSLYADLQHMSAIGPGEIQLEVLKILKGTRLEKEAVAYGLRYSPAPPYDVMDSPWMTPAEILEARYLSKIVDGFYNTLSLQDAFRKLLAHTDALQSFLVTLRQNGLDLGPAPALKQRMLWLYDFAREQRFSEVTDALRIAWMKEAFGPAGPCTDARPSNKPQDAEMLFCILPTPPQFGNETKYYTLPLSTSEVLTFAYDRSVAPNKAIAILRHCPLA